MKLIFFSYYSFILCSTEEEKSHSGFWNNIMVKKRRKICNLWVNSAFNSPEYSTRPHVGYSVCVCVCVCVAVINECGDV